LTKAVIEHKGKVIIVSSRTNVPEAVRATEQELKELNIAFSELVLLKTPEMAQANCPHDELDYWNKYLWQKVDACVRRKVSVYIDDDEKVAALFKKYAPKISVLRMMK
jgi:hypothetical protein